MFLTYNNDRNAPFTAVDSAGKSVFFPSFGSASGDFVGSQLEMLLLFAEASGADLSEGAAPVNTAVPTITGTAQVGEVLTASNGTWTGNPNPTFTRQWKADGANIAGATGTTYTPVTGDVGKVITVTVKGTNAIGNSSATSAATAAVIAAA